MTSLKPPNKLKNTPTTISGTLPDPTINLEEQANISKQLQEEYAALIIQRFFRDTIKTQQILEHGLKLTYKIIITAVTSRKNNIPNDIIPSIKHLYKLSLYYYNNHRFFKAWIYYN